MKNFAKKCLALLCGVAFALPIFAACDDGPDDGGGETPIDKVDYVSNLKLDMNSETKKQEVTVWQYIDGDTTHFKPTTSTSDFSVTNGIIKARYLAVNTPESTGTIEKWGKAASDFTHSTLEKAAAVLVESDDAQWNYDDTTSHRLLLWIWYVPEGKAVTAENYRNLNVELLQEGYGRASSVDENRYGETASAALYQAQQLKLVMYSNKADPKFHGGAATPMTLQYLRCHIAEMDDGTPVSVEGVVTAKFNHTAYIEDEFTVTIDGEEKTIKMGMAVYFQYKTGKLLDILSVGNRVNVVGKTSIFSGQYGTSYQITDVEYNSVFPNSATNTTLVEEGDPADVVPTVINAADAFGNNTKQVTCTFNEGEENEETCTIGYAMAVMDTLVKIENAEISRDIYVSDSNELTVTCTSSGVSFEFHTEVMEDDDRNPYTAEDIGEIGTKFSWVMGVMNSFNNKYQLAIYDISCLAYATA